VVISRCFSHHAYNQPPFTTGNRSFAYSRKQSAKAVFLSAKALPTVSPRGCRQRSVGKELVGNDFFADSHVSSCRQSLCRQPAVQSANADGAVNPDRGFADSPDLRLSAKTLPTAAQWLSAKPLPTAVGQGCRQSFGHFADCPVILSAKLESVVRETQLCRLFPVGKAGNQFFFSIFFPHFSCILTTFKPHIAYTSHLNTVIHNNITETAHLTIKFSFHMNPYIKVPKYNDTCPKRIHTSPTCT